MRCFSLLSHPLSHKGRLSCLSPKDSWTSTRAPGNQWVLCFAQENDFAQASSYADLAVTSDRYNPSALTNKGNTVFADGDYEKAAEFYREALRNDSSCTEALYNIGEWGTGRPGRRAGTGATLCPWALPVCPHQLPRSHWCWTWQFTFCQTDRWGESLVFFPFNHEQFQT